VAGKVDDRVHGAPPLNGRVSAAPPQDQEWGGLWRGWVYSLYAPYLAYLAAAAVLLGTAGPLGRRLALLGLWVAAGVALGGAACWPRLRAESHWGEAAAREARGDYDGARRELEAAVAQFPPFGQMQRTWLLAGRLDYRQRRATPQEKFFLAYQHGRNKEWRRALAALDDLASGSAYDRAAVRRLAARVAVAAGLERYTKDRLAPAEDLWARAGTLAPTDRDAGLLLGMSRACSDRQRPERVAEALALLLAGSLADQPLRADGLVLLANAYFLAGQPGPARRRFAESLDLYTLPSSPNYRAAKGLGGM
jgi:hypothetical protein